jgi:hypothetical protein
LLYVFIIPYLVSLSLRRYRIPLRVGLAALRPSPLAEAAGGATQAGVRVEGGDHGARDGGCLRVESIGT